METKYFIYFHILFIAITEFCSAAIYECNKKAVGSGHLWIYKSLCLKIDLNHKDWYDARNKCAKKGGDLVQIRDQVIQDSVASTLQSLHLSDTKFWLGTTDTEKEGQWKWVSGDRAMPYSNWNPGQGPNQRGFLFNAGSFEDCGLLDSRDNSRWHDYPCSGGPAFHYAFICQYEMTHNSAIHLSTAAVDGSETTESLETTRRIATHVPTAASNTQRFSPSNSKTASSHKNPTETVSNIQSNVPISSTSWKQTSAKSHPPSRTHSGPSTTTSLPSSSTYSETATTKSTVRPLPWTTSTEFPETKMTTASLYAPKYFSTTESDIHRVGYSSSNVSYNNKMTTLPYDNELSSGLATVTQRSAPKEKQSRKTKPRNSVQSNVTAVTIDRKTEHSKSMSNVTRTTTRNKSVQEVSEGSTIQLKPAKISNVNKFKKRIAESQIYYNEATSSNSDTIILVLSICGSILVLSLIVVSAAFIRRRHLKRSKTPEIRYQTEGRVNPMYELERECSPRHGADYNCVTINDIYMATVNNESHS